MSLAFCITGPGRRTLFAVRTPCATVAAWTPMDPRLGPHGQSAKHFCHRRRTGGNTFGCDGTDANHDNIVKHNYFLDSRDLTKVHDHRSIQTRRPTKMTQVGHAPWCVQEAMVPQCASRPWTCARQFSLALSVTPPRPSTRPAVLSTYHQVGKARLDGQDGVAKPENT